MVKIARLIGGAGCGKTSALLDLMDHAVERYHDPFLVGFVSFTRAARREASSRAGCRYDISPQKLEHDGWFRTLHSTCRKCLGVGQEMLTDNKESLEWVKEAIQEDIDHLPGSSEHDAFEYASETSDVVKILAMWNAARHRLVPLEEVWRDSYEVTSRIPELYYCRHIVDRYEEKKLLDRRLDFTDLILRFAGWSCNSLGASRRTPGGMPPDVPVWLLDEHQDASPALHAVCDRLIQNATWCYVVGDCFQSIYGWCGADPSMFMNGWKYDASKIMPKSWRCPTSILALGERVISNCSDYFDRGIAPADHEGDVERNFWKDLPSIVHPGEDWLVLTRTNWQAGVAGRMLDKHGMPWINTKGGGRWAAPKQLALTQAFTALENGDPIDGAQWKLVVSEVPSSFAGDHLLVRGTKARWEKMSEQEAFDSVPWIMPDHLTEVGATPAFVRFCTRGPAASSYFSKLFPRIRDIDAAICQWGLDAVAHPKIRIGTIHSAKGKEADNVAMLTAVPAPVERSKRTQRGRDEEARVSYVGVTRARRRLVVLSDERAGYCMEI